MNSPHLFVLHTGQPLAPDGMTDHPLSISETIHRTERARDKRAIFHLELALSPFPVDRKPCNAASRSYSFLTVASHLLLPFFKLKLSIPRSRNPTPFPSL